MVCCTSNEPGWTASTRNVSCDPVSSYTSTSMPTVNPQAVLLSGQPGSRLMKAVPDCANSGWRKVVCTAVCDATLSHVAVSLRYDAGGSAFEAPRLNGKTAAVANPSG